MGKKSVRENKNIYQLLREENNLTMDQAAEQMQTVSVSRIEKIEAGKTAPYADEVLAMANCYKSPDLCNHYCSNECPIGKIYVPEIKNKDLAHIVLEMIATLNNLEHDKDRLIEIAADGEISGEEEKDFNYIRAELEKISQLVDSLQLWMEKQK